MLTLIAHIHGRPGCASALHAYETKALALFTRHGGEILSAFRPAADAEGREVPDEIHVLRIASREAFQAFLKDPDRLSLEAERESAILSVRVYFSEEEIAY
jgi:uncharacterized protein (DUF1330 family)